MGWHGETEKDWLERDAKMKRMAVEIEAWREMRIEHAVDGRFAVVFGVDWYRYYDTIDDAIDALMAERDEADASVRPADLEE